MRHLPLAIVLCLTLGACANPPFEIRVPVLEATATTNTLTAPTAVPSTVGPSPTLPPTLVPTAIPTPLPTPTPLPPSPIQVALVGEPETLHPLYARSLAARNVLGALMVGCVGVDENGQPIALGCERVPSQQNGDAKYVGEGLERALEVTFRIRDGWRWTDGTPVTAQDAIFAWQLVMTPQALARDGLTQKVFSMKASGSRAIVVRFFSAAQARAAAAGTLKGDVPFEYFSSLGDYAAYAKQDTPLSDPQYWAVLRWLPAHLLRDIKAGDQARSAFARKPVGDGAFEIAEWTAGSRITLQRAKPPFPVEPAGRAPQLVFLFARDEAAALALVASGAAQIGPVAPRAQLERILGPSITRTLPASAPGFEQITLNAGRAPFDDPAVRQAVALALQGSPDVLAAVGSAVQTPTMFALDGGFQATAGLAPNPEAGLIAARDALRASGWLCSQNAPCQKAVTQTNRAGAVTATVTRTLQFTLVTNEREPRTNLIQAIQRRLAQAGFAVDVQIVFGVGAASRLFAPADQGGILASRGFDAALFELQPINRLSRTFSCAAIPDPKTGSVGENYAGLCDPRLDLLVRAAETSPSLIAIGQPSPDMQAALDAASRATVIVPLYAIPQAYPNQGVRNARPRSEGLVVTNPWAWER
jgi:ABC-type transport system substrate-binding protein